RSRTRPIASLMVAGRWNSKSFMSGSLSLLGGLDRAPDLLGGRGLSDEDHRGRHADRAALADALDADRVVGARGDVVADLEARQVGRARHAVVHVRAV